MIGDAGHSSGFQTCMYVYYSCYIAFIAVLIQLFVSLRLHMYSHTPILKLYRFAHISCIEGYKLAACLGLQNYIVAILQ